MFSSIPLNDNTNIYIYIYITLLLYTVFYHLSILYITRIFPCVLYIFYKDIAKFNKYAILMFSHVSGFMADMSFRKFGC